MSTVIFYVEGFHDDRGIRVREAFGTIAAAKARAIDLSRRAHAGIFEVFGFDAHTIAAYANGQRIK